MGHYLAQTAADRLCQQTEAAALAFDNAHPMLC